MLCLCGVLFTAQPVAADIAWSSPSQLSTSGVNASNPKVAVDANGNAYAVWVEGGYVRYSTQPNGGSWSAATTLSLTNGGATPTLVIDPSGDVTFIWVDSTLAYSASITGGSLGSVIPLSNSGASQPHIAVDASGNLVAVWARNGVIESSTKTSGGAWLDIGDVEVISSQVAEYPHVAIGDENVVVIWHSVVDSTYTVLSASKSISGSWSAPTAISTAGVNSIYPHIAVDVGGNALAVWFTYDYAGVAYSNVQLQAAYQTSGGSWGTPVEVSETGIVNPAQLTAHVGFDGNMNGIATWTNSLDGSTYYFNLSYLPYNGTWNGPFTVIGENLYAFSASLGIEPQGHAQLLNLAYDSSSSNLEIQANEFDLFAQFPQTTSFAIISTGAYNDFPTIAVNSNSTTLFTAGAWVNYNGSNQVINAATGSGAIYLPPSTVSVTQNSENFNVFTDYYNTVSWSEDADPTTYEYLVFRNGNLIAEVSSDLLSYDDHNQVQGGSVVYGVAALNSSNEQSTIQTASYP